MREFINPWAEALPETKEERDQRLAESGRDPKAHVIEFSGPLFNIRVTVHAFEADHQELSLNAMALLGSALLDIRKSKVPLEQELRRNNLSFRRDDILSACVSMRLGVCELYGAASSHDKATAVMYALDRLGAVLKALNTYPIVATVLEKHDIVVALKAHT